jgi:hypothetical protein
LHETVNRGVLAARAWCAEQGIEVKREVPWASSSSPVGLEFTEEMTGHIGVGETDVQLGAARGALAGTTLRVHLTVRTEDVDRFVTDPDHVAALSGYVASEAFGGMLPVQHGTFNLFVDRGDPTRKEMRYRLQVEDGEGKPLTIVGVKTVQSGNPLLIWRETTTLYTLVLRGRVAPLEDDYAEIAAAGIIRITVPAFLRQLTTLRTSGFSLGARVAGLTRFAALFLGKLWDVYADSVLHPGPVSGVFVGKLLARPQRSLQRAMTLTGQVTGR